MYTAASTASRAGIDASRTPIVVWFRRDLRLDDHPALSAAIDSRRPIVPLVVMDPVLERAATMGARRWARYEATVAALDRDLSQIGGRAIVRAGDPRRVVPQVVAETGAEEVLASRDVTPYAVRRDAEVGRSVALRLLPGSLIVEPETIGEVRVFTPFHRRWQAMPRPVPLPSPTAILVPTGIESLAIPSVPPLGGPEALASLDRFARHGAARYAEDRDRLDLDGTSGLSIDLHFGSLSVRRAAAAVDAPGFARQLAWRDWAHHLVWFHPDIAGARTYGRETEIAWRDDPAGVASWQDGLTGYPTVDAGMRQLRAEGTIHNRARMIAASFLTKDLLVDWRVGEAHFLRHLLDADVANNSLGWRWTAGVGPDAAPFIRVLNPSLQGERFDPHGRWVRRWVPEVAALSDRFVHRPWLAPDGPPRGYPGPIVDHRIARERALSAFRSRRRP